MECITDNTPPPMELRLAWQCERWNSLPEPGGLYEQDYRILYRMTAMLNVYRTVLKIKNQRPKDIHTLTHNERLVLRRLYEAGILFHA